MQKLFDNYKGIIFFYIVIVLITFIYIIRINTINSVTDSNPRETNYYAYNK